MSMFMYNAEYEEDGINYIRHLSPDRLMKHVMKQCTVRQILDEMGGKHRVIDYILIDPPKSNNLSGNDWILDRFENDYLIEYLVRNKALEFFDEYTK